MGHVSCVARYPSRLQVCLDTPRPLIVFRHRTQIALRAIPRHSFHISKPFASSCPGLSRINGNERLQLYFVFPHMRQQWSLVDRHIVARKASKDSFLKQRGGSSAVRFLCDCWCARVSHEERKTNKWSRGEEKAGLLGTTFKLAVQTGRDRVEFPSFSCGVHIQRAMLHCTHRLITFFTASRKPFYGATLGRGGARREEIEREGLGYLETNKLCFPRRGESAAMGAGRRTNEVAESNRCAGSRTSKRGTRRRARFLSSLFFLSSFSSAALEKLSPPEVPMSSSTRYRQ